MKTPAGQACCGCTGLVGRPQKGLLEWKCTKRIINGSLWGWEEGRVSKAFAAQDGHEDLSLGFENRTHIRSPA